jgi:hypothetical protein
MEVTYRLLRSCDLSNPQTLKVVADSERCECEELSARPETKKRRPDESLAGRRIAGLLSGKDSLE